MTTLDLSDNQIEDIGARLLFNSLENNKTITTVRLTGNNSKYCEAIGIAIGIRNDKTLTNIDLRLKEYGDNEIKLLVNELYNNKTITDLDFNKNEISNIGIQYLADMLRNNTTIIWIDLSQNQIGDVGAKYLGDALKNNKATIAENDHDPKPAFGKALSGHVRLPKKSQFVLIYSADPGTVSFADGPHTNGNSYFTHSLLNHISTPNTKIEDMMKEVSREIKFKSRHRQRPWINLCLHEDFYFQKGTLNENL
ncbi:unnamed protein product [Adineta steineri]|uniref:Peptidase C14 caspase domain-containing protein n=1 Tax=Adineta steineri TaxID=433720 RepID=A0A814Y3D8_9BILA|nr:unnamed protein product [Adineta steineri]